MVKNKSEVQKKVDRRICCKKKYHDKLENKRENYCKDLEDKEDNNALYESNKPNYDKLYYKDMNETKIFHNYMY